MTMTKTPRVQTEKPVAAEKLKNPTRNSLPEAVRTSVAALLNARLADALDLYSQIKQSHWNVRGPSFIALHELFDKIAEEVEGYSDEMAERCVQLGGMAQGTTRTVAKTSTLKEHPIEGLDWRGHVEHLASLLGTFGGTINDAVAETTESGDTGTADLLTGVSQGVDKALWFLEAHLA
jgi:starvation-inducible DNA-binding protein